MKDIIKLEKEIAAEKDKIAKQQNRLRELENQKIEAENVYIVAIVRKSCVSIDELESIAEKYKITLRLQPPGRKTEGVT